MMPPASSLKDHQTPGVVGKPRLPAARPCGAHFPPRKNVLREGLLRVIAALLLVIGANACASRLPDLAGAGDGSSAAVTQEVTRLVTQDVTREVTRQVVVPVTLAPTVTPRHTPTPSEITAIPTTGLPEITIPEYTDCLYGPADFFLYKTSLPAGGLMEVVGQNPDGSWIDVEAVQGWDPCWIPSGRLHLDAGTLESVPVVYPDLPVSYWYKPPSPSAHRDGSAVTVSWKAVGMAEYDYRGYLILAWVCRGGERVYLPLSIAPPYAENTGSLSVTIKDEPGCGGFSSATIYTAEKRGYYGELVFWPQP